MFELGIDEALNMTAIVGNKGMEHPYQCLDNNDGTNVLSVTFKPASLTLVMYSNIAGSITMCHVYCCSILHGRSPQAVRGDPLCKLQAITSTMP